MGYRRQRSVLLQKRSQDAHSLFKPEVFPELVDLHLQPRLVLRIMMFSLLDVSWLLSQATDSGWHQGLDLGCRKTVRRTRPTQPRNLERNYNLELLFCLLEIRVWVSPNASFNLLF